MCILRYEIPKPLDPIVLVETAFSPVYVSASQILNRPVKSAYPNTPSSALAASIQSSSQNVSNQQPVQASLGYQVSADSAYYKSLPSMLSTQTNDNTTCVYYPNGHKAILIANVFGFSVETGSALGTQQSSVQQPSSQNNLTSMSGSFTSANVANTSSLTWQSVKNSYSTIIYDLYNEGNRKVSRYSYKSSFSTATSSGIESRSKEREDDKKTVSINVKPQSRHERDGRLLAIITPTGNCVYYRDNGKPR